MYKSQPAGEKQMYCTLNWSTDTSEEKSTHSRTNVYIIQLSLSYINFKSQDIKKSCRYASLQKVPGFKKKEKKK